MAEATSMREPLNQIFKDSDCIDRIRFANFRKEFDFSYLRTNVAKKSLLIAAGFYYGKGEVLLQ